MRHIFYFIPAKQTRVSFHTRCACPVPAPLFTIICILLIFPHNYICFHCPNTLYPDTLWKRYSIYTIQYLAFTYKSTANQNPCDRHIFITVFYSIAISRQEVKIIYKSVKILKAFFSKSIYNVDRICCGAISAPQQSIKLKHKNL